MMAAARSGNPAATKSAMLNFVRVADVNPQLRLGVLQFLSNIDPSLAGMSEREIFLKWNGTIPPDQLQNLQKIIDATYKENYARYDRQWSYMHSKHPTADITPPEVLFGKWNGAGSSTDGSTPAGDAPGAAAQRARDALKP
jgi:hypothetical protein